MRGFVVAGISFEMLSFDVQYPRARNVEEAEGRILFL
jgi:hypothetical protein